ncbi:transcription initiation factor IIF subunit alpha-like isoform X2 [Phragmites australis]|uniref:transcription initiation factor IIF subunit alpha-like isoform X2 n=1 Tax=Phragmites australis TaxID=29695 RepID=UPI002D76731F|nr:transcription initiation factor IIF subunit alpha-like isoform X2 [Phragmites australis]
MGSGSAAADLVPKAACEACGAASDLYVTECRHATLCHSCGAAMARARGRCAVCAAPVTTLIREYTVRVDTTGEKALSVGRFTTGLPPFSKKRSAGSRWSLRKDGLQVQRRQLTGSMREKYCNRKPWILEDETGEYQYQGQAVGSPSATATHYLLMLHGKEFHAVPIGSWHNFSKIAQYKQLTLEEAEEKMNRRRSGASGYERWMMKAAANGAAAFSSDVKKLDDVKRGAAGGVHPNKGDRNDDGNQSDKGEEDEEEGAARKNRHGLTTKGMEDDKEGGKDRDYDLDDEIEKGDDWEHEETFTDDDEALDIDTEERAVLADPEAAPPDIKQDDNENELGGSGNLSKSGQELKKLLRRAAGQDESDNDDKDTDEDEPPSPVLAPKQMVQPKSEPGDNNPAKPTLPVHAQSTTPAYQSTQKRRPGGDDANISNGAASKKIKMEPETKTSVVKDETLPSLEPSSEASLSASTTNSSPITEEEVRTVLHAVAPVTSQDLVSRFKSRIKTQEDKKEFTAILRKISHMLKTNGRNYILLRKEYK